jgi:exopolysaccharide biosynthesis polyprenyl glycosylphosphotransferase
LATRSLGSGIVTWIAPRPKSGWRGRAKRLFDVVVASTVVAVVSPLFAVIALVIKLTSPGPVFFRQERVGRYGEPFDMLKFRSMVINAEELLAELQLDNEGAGPLFKMKSDPRVTSIGRFIRKSSLDELPQLLNVLRNEMSLVGPRPALRAEMVDWEPALYARLDVKPGITGMWQVSGRSGTTFAEYTRLDLYYVHNWSMLVDLSIMLRTIPAVLRSEGAF